ncbi:MAG: chemotaxis protein CheC, partial [Solirubrobacteraceae bacterium]
MSADIGQRDALMRLGAAGAEAVAQVLDMFAPGAVERGDVSVLAAQAQPFAGLTPGSVAASVSYVEGVTGANVFVLPAAGVRKLAQGMGMPPSEDGAEAELSELEMSAVGEAANQMMAAAASAIGVVIGQEIEISVPDIRVLADPSAAGEIYGSSPYATSTTFLIGGESCRLICLVPSAFLVRMARALDELAVEAVVDEVSGGAAELDADAQTLALADALGVIKLRVWAELGRTRLALGPALGLPLGSVV